MTTDSYSAGIPPDQPKLERPADPRPAWERVAYTWLEREVDHGQPVDPAELAREVSVAPGFAADLVRVLRAHRQHDPTLTELRGRLVGDRITDAYLARELPGNLRLDPATLSHQVGTTATVARQWLHTLRVGNQTDRRLASLRAEPVSHGRPTAEQLAALQATYAGGGRPQPNQQPAAAAPPLERIEQLYQGREVTGGRPLDPAQVARQIGVSEHYVRGTLAALRGGTQTNAERIEQLWRLWEVQGGQRLATADLARLVGVARAGSARCWGRCGPPTATPPAPTGNSGRWWSRMAAGRHGWTRLPAATPTPSGSSPNPVSRPKAAEAKAICAGCQVRDPCRDLAVKAAGGIDTDHSVFGGTLPTERSRLRGNHFPQPSAYRQRRDLAEAAHTLAGQVGLRQAAGQLGIHRDALKAAFTQWELPMPERRQGWQPSRFLTDRGEAERAFQLATQLGSVNAAAQELGTSWPSLRKAFTATAWACQPPTPRPSASGRSRRPAGAAASRPPRPWTRCLWPSTPAPSQPANGRRPSCTSGSAATSSTPPWAPTW